MTVAASFQNALRPGTYFVRCWVVRDMDEEEEVALQFIDVLRFDVVGESGGLGLVSLPADVEIRNGMDPR